MVTDVQKLAAARYAAELVKEGMTVGLGSGTTAQLMVRALGERVQAGLQVVGVTTSEETARIARSFGIELVSVDECGRLDMVIDGADEVDPDLNLIKGRGGALLWEKIVGRAAEEYVIIVDAGKRVDRLGDHAPVPIEVVPFGWTTTRSRLQDLNLECQLRGGHTPFFTDSHNYVLDCTPRSPLNLAASSVADSIKLQTGVVEHGLFLKMATMVVVGTGPDKVEVLRR